MVFLWFSYGFPTLLVLIFAERQDFEKKVEIEAAKLRARTKELRLSSPCRTIKLGRKKEAQKIELLDTNQNRS